MYTFKYIETHSILLIFKNIFIAHILTSVKAFTQIWIKFYEKRFIKCTKFSFSQIIYNEVIQKSHMKGP